MYMRKWKVAVWEWMGVITAILLGVSSVIACERHPQWQAFIAAVACVAGVMSFFIAAGHIVLTPEEKEYRKHCR